MVERKSVGVNRVLKVLLVGTVGVLALAGCASNSTSADNGGAAPTPSQVESEGTASTQGSDTSGTADELIQQLKVMDGRGDTDGNSYKMEDLDTWVQAIRLAESGDSTGAADLIANLGYGQDMLEVGAEWSKYRCNNTEYAQAVNSSAPRPCVAAIVTYFRDNGVFDQLPAETNKDIAPSGFYTVLYMASGINDLYDLKGSASNTIQATQEVIAECPDLMSTPENVDACQTFNQQIMRGPSEWLERQ